MNDTPSVTESMADAKKGPRCPRGFAGMLEEVGALVRRRAELYEASRESAAVAHAALGLLVLEYKRRFGPEVVQKWKNTRIADLDLSPDTKADLKWDKTLWQLAGRTRGEMAKRLPPDRLMELEYALAEYKLWLLRD